MPGALEGVWAVPAVPLAAAFALLCVGARLPSMAVRVVAAGAMAAAFALSLVFVVKLGGGVASEPLWTVLDVEWLRVGAALRLDRLSTVMLLVITSVGTLVAVYSGGYLHGEKGEWRFFAALCLFVAAMAWLVLADDLAMVFVGWEGVGVASWLLIGHWYEDPAKAKAALKAFITNRGVTRAC